MNINKNCKLFLTDLYYYDIESCHYNILKRLNYDISDLTLKNKDERNIQIGLLMKKNPNIIPIIRSLTESMINEFLSENKINDDLKKVLDTLWSFLEDLQLIEKVRK